MRVGDNGASAFEHFEVDRVSCELLIRDLLDHVAGGEEVED
jgi:hypothetical protein